MTPTALRGLGAAHGIEQQVDRRAVAVDRLALAQAAFARRAFGDLDVLRAARREIDAAGKQRRAVVGDGDLRREALVQPRREARREGRGMCWAITVGGQLAGNAASTAISASTPPVDEPIATMRRPGSVATFARRAAASRRCSRRRWRAASPWRPSSPWPAARRGCPDCRATGLATQSKAPISSARIVSCAPRCVRVETMITGIGRSRMIFSRNSRPFIFGISTSSVTHVGLQVLDRLRAPPADRRPRRRPRSPGRGCSSAPISPRMVAESSTTRTRTRASSAASLEQPIGGELFLLEARRHRRSEPLGMADVEARARGHQRDEACPDAVAASSPRNR